MASIPEQEWIIYSRSGCGLCEEFLVALEELLVEENCRALVERVRVVDIESESEFGRKYADRIPVLTIDDDFICAYKLDRERVLRYLQP